MKSLNGKMRKLQTAIIKNGLVVKINTDQFYSADQKRMITGYRLMTPYLYYSKKYHEYKTGDFEILHTYSVVDLIFCLLDIYRQMQVWGVVRDLTDEVEEWET